MSNKAAFGAAPYLSERSAQPRSDPLAAAAAAVAAAAAAVEPDSRKQMIIIIGQKYLVYH